MSRILDVGISLSSTDAERLAAFWRALRLAMVGVFAWAADIFDGKGPNGLIAVYLTFILFDYLTGVLASVLAGKVQSGIALKGIVKKLMGLAAVCVGHSIDVFLGTHQATGLGWAQGTITRMLIGYELISICENLAAGGIILPAAVKDVIQRVTKGDGGGGASTPPPASAEAPAPGTPPDA